MTHLRSALGLVALVVVCFAAAGVGGALMSRTPPDWYPSLQKPAWTPPGWVFGPVWTFLYLTMAGAAWLVWRRGDLREARLPLGLFGLQLALNAAWPGLFFGLRMPGPAFVELCALWCVLLATVIAFFRESRAAGLLLVPYLAWSTFAGVLNLAIWRMNA